ncbi:hypothetical protein [Helicobacter pylori]|nr:hypothetical protein [Helicobacter pylori]
MGRDEILQQTPLNFISSNAKNKAFLKQRISVIEKRYFLNLVF